MSKTVDWCIARAFLHSQRKSVAPASGTSKYNVLLAIADSMQKLWQSEPDMEWDSLYQDVAIGTMGATTTSFDLDDSIAYISKREGDQAYATNGTTTKYYDIIKPNQVERYRYSAVVSQNGRTLNFPSAPGTTSSVIGYTFYLPSYIYVDDITLGTNEVQVDDPMWLVYMMAAEFVRNDVVKQGQYDNLLNLANQTMEKMKDANGGQIDEVVRPWQPMGESWV